MKKASSHLTGSLSLKICWGPAMVTRHFMTIGKVAWQNIPSVSDEKINTASFGQWSGDIKQELRCPCVV